MTYYGTTASSSLANPPIGIPLAMGSNSNGIGGRTMWIYASADSAATVAGSSYFSDGDALGMKVGDPMICILVSSAGTTSSVPYLGAVGAVTSGGAATINTLTS